jgi:hypothetical protein
MFTSDPDPYRTYKQRHRELLRLVEQERQAQIALKSRQPHKRNATIFLAQVGRILTSLGSRLEERYGAQAKGETSLKKQGETGGC